jgi:hypothetical protein
MPAPNDSLKNNFFAFTVDVDWAPDYMIDYMAEAFTAAGARVTWFLTHASPAVDRLRHNPLFELGIHPNFLPGSTHGSSDDAVMKHCLELAPGAKSVRTHALVQNSRLMWMMRHKYDIRVDCSLFLPFTPNIIPHTLCHSAAEVPLVRIPFFWEDDVECLRPNRSWNASDANIHVHGIKMFNFHPMYVGLNEDDFKRYESVKSELCKGRPLNELSQEELIPYTNTGAGVNTFFKGILEHIRINNLPTFTAAEIAEHFLSKQ